MLRSINGHYISEDGSYALFRLNDTSTQLLPLSLGCDSTTDSISDILAKLSGKTVGALGNIIKQSQSTFPASSFQHKFKSNNWNRLANWIRRYPASPAVLPGVEMTRTEYETHQLQKVLRNFNPDTFPQKAFNINGSHPLTQLLIRCIIGSNASDNAFPRIFQRIITKGSIEEITLAANILEHFDRRELRLRFVLQCLERGHAGSINNFGLELVQLGESEKVLNLIAGFSDKERRTPMVRLVRAAALCERDEESWREQLNSFGLLGEMETDSANLFLAEILLQGRESDSVVDYLLKQNEEFFSKNSSALPLLSVALFEDGSVMESFSELDKLFTRKNNVFKVSDFAAMLRCFDKERASEVCYQWLKFRISNSKGGEGTIGARRSIIHGDFLDSAARHEVRMGHLAQANMSRRMQYDAYERARLAGGDQFVSNFQRIKANVLRNLLTGLVCEGELEEATDVYQKLLSDLNGLETILFRYVLQICEGESPKRTGKSFHG